MRDYLGNISLLAHNEDLFALSMCQKHIALRAHEIHLLPCILELGSMYQQER